MAPCWTEGQCFPVLTACFSDHNKMNFSPVNVFLNTWGFYRMESSWCSPYLYLPPCSGIHIPHAMYWQLSPVSPDHKQWLQCYCLNSEKWRDIWPTLPQMVKNFWCRQTKKGFHKRHRTWAESWEKKKKDGRHESGILDRRTWWAKPGRGSMKHVWTVSREIWLEQRVPLGKQARETLGKSFSQQNQHRWQPWGRAGILWACSHLIGLRPWPTVALPLSWVSISSRDSVLCPLVFLP